MSLPIKKIYVDSLFKLPESLDSSSLELDSNFSLGLDSGSAIV